MRQNSVLLFLPLTDGANQSFQSVHKKLLVGTDGELTLSPCPGFGHVFRRMVHIPADFVPLLRLFADLANGVYHQGYCLISPYSFSCGNLLPGCFKESGIVTLIGQKSGGGSCVVRPCTTASGAVFQISGSKQLTTVINGSFYNIDQGIEPDIRLTKFESFYDREGLVELIHGTR